jgi:quinol monooxygenase YgiN
MSVIVTLQMQGDPGQLEAFAAENKESVRAIADKAKEHGVIAHRFYGTDDGQIMVVDEWPDAQSFQRFFDEMGPKIGPMFEGMGVTEEPRPTFWRKLETHDEIGWEDR